MAVRDKTAKPIKIDSRLELVMNLASVLASIVGVTALFFHFGVFSGVAFLAFSIFAFVASSRIMLKLDDLNQG
jgi:hypothetical protein